LSYFQLEIAQQKLVSDFVELIPIRDCTAETGFGFVELIPIRDCTADMEVRIKMEIRSGFLGTAVHN
jgi:hypothetical protein